MHGNRLAEIDVRRLFTEELVKKEEEAVLYAVHRANELRGIAAGDAELPDNSPAVSQAELRQGSAAALMEVGEKEDIVNDEDEGVWCFQCAAGGWKERDQSWQSLPERWTTYLKPLALEKKAGAFGQVRFAVSRSPCEELGGDRIVVALKFQYPQTEPQWRSAMSELSFMRRLESPELLGYWDYEVEKTSIVILMEWFGYGSLKDMIIKYEGAYSLKQRAVAFVDVLRGLIYAKKQGVVHRDLKPDNIFITSSGRGKLADWGISCGGNPTIEKCDAFAGTALYVAPEIWNLTKIVPEGSRYRLVIDNPEDMERAVSPASDMWSMGVIFCEMFHRVPHFLKSAQRVDVLRESILKLEERLRGDRVWYEATPEVRAILRGMLTTDPQKRVTPEELLPLVISWAESVLGVPRSILTASPSFTSLPSCLKPIKERPAPRTPLITPRLAPKPAPFVSLQSRASDATIRHDPLLVPQLVVDGKLVTHPDGKENAGSSSSQSDFETFMLDAPGSSANEDPPLVRDDLGLPLDRSGEFSFKTEKFKVDQQTGKPDSFAVSEASDPPILDMSDNPVWWNYDGERPEDLRDVTLVVREPSFQQMGARCCCDKHRSNFSPWRRGGACIVVMGVHTKCGSVPAWLTPGWASPAGNARTMHEYKKTQGGRCEIREAQVEALFANFGLPPGPHGLVDVTDMLDEMFSLNGLRCCCDKNGPRDSKNDYFRSGRCVISGFPACGKVPQAQRPGLTPMRIHSHTRVLDKKCELLPSEAEAFYSRRVFGNVS